MLVGEEASYLCLLGNDVPALKLWGCIDASLEERVHRLRVDDLQAMQTTDRGMNSFESIALESCFRHRKSPGASIYPRVMPA